MPAPHRLWRYIGAAVLVAALIAAGLYYRSHQAKPATALTEKDTIVLADFSKNPAAAVNALQAAVPPIELGQIAFVNNISCLYPTYVRGEAYLAAGQGKEAAAEFQKIIDHSGIVWNCWTGALARLGVARANALEAGYARVGTGVSPVHAEQSSAADRDLARSRALTAYKDFLSLWKDADPDIPILKEAKAEYAKLQ